MFFLVTKFKTEMAGLSNTLSDAPKNKLFGHVFAFFIAAFVQIAEGFKFG